MMGALFIVGLGAIFGLALAAPPGPMNAIIAEESVSRGIIAGIKAGLGAMTADLVFFGLAVLGVGTFVLERPLLQGIMIGIGGLLMLFFGSRTLLEAQRRSDWSIETTASSRGFWKTFVLGITNPYQLAFWLTVGVALIRPDQIDLGRYLPGVSQVVIETGNPLLFIGFFGGIVVWITAFPLGLRYLGQRIDRFAPHIALLSAAVLLGFGAWFLIDGGRTILG